MSAHPGSCVCTACCDADAAQDSARHRAQVERDNTADAAAHAQPGDCYRHFYQEQLGGGGICIYCGDTIGAGEL